MPPTGGLSHFSVVPVVSACRSGLNRSPSARPRSAQAGIARACPSHPSSSRSVDCRVPRGTRVGSAAVLAPAATGTTGRTASAHDHFFTHIWGQLCGLTAGGPWIVALGSVDNSCGRRGWIRDNGGRAEVVQGRRPPSTGRPRVTSPSRRTVRPAAMAPIHIIHRPYCCCWISLLRNTQEEKGGGWGSVRSARGGAGKGGRPGVTPAPRRLYGGPADLVLPGCRPRPDFVPFASGSVRQVGTLLVSGCLAIRSQSRGRR